MRPVKGIAGKKRLINICRIKCGMDLQISAGQKTTAILTFLLAYGDLPLLLDQPEDDLDNKLVYDLIVTRLKEAKSKRQIIVVTHNANIPVNADAEFIVSMDSESEQVAIKYEGTMDDKNVRKEIPAKLNSIRL